MTRIVTLLSHSGAVPAISELTGRAETVVVGPVDAVRGAAVHRLVIPEPSGLARAIVALAWRTPLGRNVIRLLPLDRSRRLWRAARRDRALAELVRSADVVVAADRDAILTVWKFAHRRSLGTGWDAVFGASAAIFALNARS